MRGAAGFKENAGFGGRIEFGEQCECPRVMNEVDGHLKMYEQRLREPGYQAPL